MRTSVFSVANQSHSLKEEGENGRQGEIERERDGGGRVEMIRGRQDGWVRRERRSGS